MLEKLKKMAALRGAVRVLESRAKIAMAIEAELKKFQALVRERLQADRAVIETEASQVLGEPADSSGASRKAEQVSKSIAKQSSVLAGLRSRMAALTADLDTERRSVSAFLPEHQKRMKADFSEKWARGVAAFASLLGERAALEKLVGRMNLAEPQPATVELPTEVVAPWQALKSITAALEQIAGWSRAAMLPSGSRPFDPNRVYVMTRATDGMEAGEAVMGASFVPGLLERIVSIGDAVLADTAGWQSALEAGSTAAQQALSEAAETNRQRTRIREPDRGRRGGEGACFTAAAGVRKQSPVG